MFFINIFEQILHEYKNLIHKKYMVHKSALSFVF